MSLLVFSAKTLMGREDIIKEKHLEYFIYMSAIGIAMVSLRLTRGRCFHPRFDGKAFDRSIGIHFNLSMLECMTGCGACVLSHGRKQRPVVEKKKR